MLEIPEFDQSYVITGASSSSVDLCIALPVDFVIRLDCSKAQKTILTAIIVQDTQYMLQGKMKEITTKGRGTDNGGRDGIITKKRARG